MSDWLVTYEAVVRVALFVGVFAVMAIWELAAPRRALAVGRTRRWASNIGLVVLNTVVLRVLFPTAAVGLALAAEEAGWGLLQQVDLPAWLAFIGAVVVLDAAIYLQHVMFHAVPALWRLHRVHHADLDFDVTTGARFHTLEIVLSMLIKFAVIMVLGPPVAAVIVFEVLLNATSMFNHSNVRLPRSIDRMLRWLVVTPDMHRVHHSVEEDETNSNFGFNLPWWDRLFGTYRDQPRAGHTAMTIGLRNLRDPDRCDRLPAMLWMPFSAPVAGYAINRRQWGGSETPGKRH